MVPVHVDPEGVIRIGVAGAAPETS
jgi:hypothetical protein